MLEKQEKFKMKIQKKFQIIQEFKSQIEKGGFFNAPWCGKLECEEKIKEETGADIRVIPFGSENDSAKNACIVVNSKVFQFQFLLEDTSKN